VVDGARTLAHLRVRQRVRYPFERLPGEAQSLYNPLIRLGYLLYHNPWTALFNRKPAYDQAVAEALPSHRHLARFLDKAVVLDESAVPLRQYTLTPLREMVRDKATAEGMTRSCDDGLPTTRDGRTPFAFADGRQAVFTRYGPSRIDFTAPDGTKTRFVDTKSFAAVKSICRPDGIVLFNRVRDGSIAVRWLDTTGAPVGRAQLQLPARPGQPETYFGIQGVESRDACFHLTVWGQEGNYYDQRKKTALIEYGVCPTLTSRSLITHKIRPAITDGHPDRT
jgi:hypothetical protein